MTKRQLAALETRRKLIETAGKIIGEKGLENTSIEEITEACGVSKGTFYTYFKRKEDIVNELQAGRTHRSIFEDIMVKDLNVEEKTNKFLCDMAMYIEEGGPKVCQAWIRNVVDIDHSTKNGDQALAAEDISYMEEILQEGIQNKELKKNTEVRKLAETCIDILYGQMLVWAISDGGYGLQERTEEFCHSYLSDLFIQYRRK